MVAAVRKQVLLQKDIVLGNDVVDMFAKCGELTKAWDMFQQLSMKNIVSWTVMIVGMPCISLVMKLSNASSRCRLRESLLML